MSFLEEIIDRQKRDIESISKIVPFVIAASKKGLTVNAYWLASEKGLSINIVSRILNEAVDRCEIKRVNQDEYTAT